MVVPVTEDVVGKIIFCIVGIIWSVWAPILSIGSLIYPERVQKYFIKCTWKYDPLFEHTKAKLYLLELRIVAVVMILLILLLIIFFIVSNNRFLWAMSVLQLLSLIGSLLFIRFFPNKFFTKYM